MKDLYILVLQRINFCGVLSYVPFRFHECNCVYKRDYKYTSVLQTNKRLSFLC